MTLELDKIFVYLSSVDTCGIGERRVVNINGERYVRRPQRIGDSADEAAGYLYRTLFFGNSGINYELEIDPNNPLDTSRFSKIIDKLRKLKDLNDKRSVSLKRVINLGNKLVILSE